MTTVKRRSRTNNQDAPASSEGRPQDYGVTPGASIAVRGALLKYDADTDQPFCTCLNRRHGFGFDPQIGVYIHADPVCWKPSKSMYAAALAAGVIEEPKERHATNQGPKDRRG